MTSPDPKAVGEDLADFLRRQGEWDDLISPADMDTLEAVQMVLPVEQLDALERIVQARIEHARKPALARAEAAERRLAWVASYVADEKLTAEERVSIIRHHPQVAAFLAKPESRS